MSETEFLKLSTVISTRKMAENVLRRLWKMRLLIHEEIHNEIWAPSLLKKILQNRKRKAEKYGKMMQL